jgi:hypothetical protein
MSQGLLRSPLRSRTLTGVLALIIPFRCDQTISTRSMRSHAYSAPVQIERRSCDASCILDGMMHNPRTKQPGRCNPSVSILDPHFSDTHTFSDVLLRADGTFSPIARPLIKVCSLSTAICTSFMTYPATWSCSARLNIVPSPIALRYAAWPTCSNRFASRVMQASQCSPTRTSPT